MIDDIRRLLQEYAAWLQDKTLLREVDDKWIEVTTPYLDRHNDYLQIYVRRRNGGFALTDAGYIIEDLEQSGCSLDTRKRQQMLTMALNGFGVQLEHGELVVEATPQNFAVRKHNLLQAMLAVNDLFYTARPNVASLFLEDVVNWLDLKDIRFTPNAKFTGKSGLDHTFDIVIPKSRKRPERIVKAMNRPDRDNAVQLAFAWSDTREVRSPGATAFALLNDQDRAPSQDVMDALIAYEVRPVLWSRRDDVADELAA